MSRREIKIIVLMIVAVFVFHLGQIVGRWDERTKLEADLMSYQEDLINFLNKNSEISNKEDFEFALKAVHFTNKNFIQRVRFRENK